MIIGIYIQKDHGPHFNPFKAYKFITQPCLDIFLLGQNWIELIYQVK